MNRTTLTPAAASLRQTIVLVVAGGVLSLLVDLADGGLPDAVGRMASAAVGAAVLGGGTWLLDRDLRARLAAAEPLPPGETPGGGVTYRSVLMVAAVAVGLPLLVDGGAVSAITLWIGLVAVFAWQLSLIRAREREGGTVLRRGRSFYIAD